MTNQELFSQYGWELKVNDPTQPFWFKGEIYYKGNYVLILHTARRYKDADYLSIWVKDPALHNEQVGCDGNGVFFDFPFLGEATLSAINILLPLESITPVI